MTVTIALMRKGNIQEIDEGRMEERRIEIYTRNIKSHPKVSNKDQFTKMRKFKTSSPSNNQR